MAQKNSMASINFTSIIAERTEHFVGREWAFKTIDDWLSNPDGPRFFLLTGKPGSGKTAFAARLSQFSQETIPPAVDLPHLTPQFLSAVHFCSTRDTRWIRPQTFAESLAMQLARRYSAYAEALAEKSGDRQIRIEVLQHIEHAEGPVQGIVINSINANGVSPEEAFNRIVREPLEALFQDGFNQQVIILVDALDEALVYPESTNIPDLLTHAEALPRGVRFILTSRPNIELRRSLQLFHLKELTLTSGDGLVRSLQDIQQYVLDTMDRKPELENKLAPGLPRQTLIDVIQKKSGGNFLYVRYLLNMLQDQREQISLAQMDTLPIGLDSIYLEFHLKERLLKSNPQSWETEYGPILGALAVALVPLNQAQLANLTGRSESELRMTLKRLHELLDVDEVLPASQRTYSIYHRSFIDFLLDSDRSEEYQREESREHLQLANWCEKDKFSAIWEDVKYSPGEQGRREYARQHYVTHLYLSKQWSRLFAALDEGQYGRAKVQFDPSIQGYAQDLDLGRKAASWDGWTLEKKIEHLPHLWRYTLLRCSLADSVDAYPDEAFELLLQLNRDRAAVRSANMLTDPIHQARVFLLLADHFIAQPERRTEGLQLVEQAYGIIKSITGSFKEAEPLRMSLGLTLARANQWLLAREVIPTIEDDIWRSVALTELSLALSRANQWQEARDVIASIEISGWKDRALGELGLELARANQWQEARDVIPSLQAKALRELGLILARANQWQEAHDVIASIWDSDEKAPALRELGQTLVQANQEQLAIQVWQEAHDVITSMENRSKKAKALRELGLMLAQANQEQLAIQIWQEAHDVITSIWYGKAESLTELGQTLVQANQEQLAIQIWQEARDVITSIEDRSEKVKALRELGLALVHAKQWQEAREVIASIEYGKAQALGELGWTLAQAKQWQEARDVITSIKDPFEKVKALSGLGLALAQTNQEQEAIQVWQEAREIIASIEDRSKAQALKELGLALARAKQWQEAREVIASIEDRSEKAQALKELGLALARANRWQEATRAWQEARVTWAASRAGFSLLAPRAEALASLSLTLAETKQWKEAREIIASIEHSDWRVHALCWLGLALVRDNQKQEATQVWQEVREVIAAVDDYLFRSYALTRLSVTLAHAKQWQEARDIIASIEETSWKAKALKEVGLVLVQDNQKQEARKVIASIEDRSKKAKALRELGWTLAQAKQWQEAREVIASVEDRYHRAKALCWLGLALVQDNQKQEATQVWQEALDIVATIEDRSVKADTLMEVGLALARAKQWQEALDIVATIEDRSVKADTLMEVGLALVRDNQKQEATQVWQEVREVIASIEDRSEKAQALGMLGLVLAQAKQWQEACDVIASIDIEDSYHRAQALKELGLMLIQTNPEPQATQIWPKVRDAIATIKDRSCRAWTLSELCQGLALACQWQRAYDAIVSIETNSDKEQSWKTATLSKLGDTLRQFWKRAQGTSNSIQNSMVDEIDFTQETGDEYLQLLGFLQQVWLHVNSYDEALSAFSLADGLILLEPALGIPFFQAFGWVDAFLEGKDVTRL